MKDKRKRRILCAITSYSVNASIYAHPPCDFFHFSHSGTSV